MKKTLLLLLIFLTTFSFGCRLKGEPSTPIMNNNLTPATMQLEPKSGDTIAIMTTNHGEIRLLLYTKQVPETTKNFIELSNQGKYDGNIFHRVIKDFMIQGGDFEKKNGTGGYTYKGPGTKLNDEVVKGLTHVRGALSMAKTPLPNSAGSQFFIVQATGGTPHLDGIHTVFGYAYEGMDTVDEIADVEKGPMDKPLEDVVIEKIEIVKF